MIQLKRTNSNDKTFQLLVKELDIELAVRDGNEHAFYAQYNKLDLIRHAVVAYFGETPVGCGAIKEFSPEVMEVKRMYVPLKHRGQGIASLVLKELEKWARELGYKKCILETGKKQPEAIRLYEKNGYKSIPNYSQYSGVENSVCYEKAI